MAPGTCFSLCFCLLVFLASGTLADEEPTHGPPVHREDAALLAVKSQGNDTTKCPKKWFSNGSFCFRYIGCPTTFEDAEDECQSYGSHVHLTSIRDMPEAALLVKYVIPDNVKSNIWIGLTNVGQECNVWRWINGDNSNYYSWGRNQPSVCSGAESCAQLTETSSFFLWEDKDCHDRAGFICRYHL